MATITLSASAIETIKTFVATMSTPSAFVLNPEIHTPNASGGCECAKHGTFTDTCFLCVNEAEMEREDSILRQANALHVIFSEALPTVTTK